MADSDGHGDDDRKDDRERRRRSSKSPSSRSDGRRKRGSRSRSGSSDRRRRRRERSRSRSPSRRRKEDSRERSRDRDRDRNRDRDRDRKDPDLKEADRGGRPSRSSRFNVAPAPTVTLPGPGLAPVGYGMPSVVQAVPAALPSFAGLGGAMGGVNPLLALGGLAGMPQVDKVVRELFIGNTPPGTSDFVLMEFLNGAMKQVKLVTSPGNPIISCRVSNKFAFVELRSIEETTAALSMNGIPFMGQCLNISRPSKYRGPQTAAKTWQQLTGATTGAAPTYEQQQQHRPASDPSTKVFRELYIGNTTSAMTEQVLQSFLSSTMEKVGLSKGPGDPVVHIRNSGNFGFVEFRSVEEATNALCLSGIPFMGQMLKISRPAKYPGPAMVHPTWDDLVARLGGSIPGLDLSGAAQGVVPVPAAFPQAFPGAIPGLIPGFMPGAGAAAAAAAAAAVGVPMVTRVVRLSNMVTDEDLRSDESIDELQEETTDECKNFGEVRRVLVPKNSVTEPNQRPGIGFVFVEFGDVVAAARAAASLRQRSFDGRKVDAVFWNEEAFARNDLTPAGAAPGQRL